MEKDLIFETAHWKVILATNQYYLGRSIIFLKRECNSLSELTNEEFLDLLNIIKKMEYAIKKSFTTTLFNWGCFMNHAYKKAEKKPQVHFHLFPRYDKIIKVQNENFIDNEFGNIFNIEKNKEIDEELRINIINTIKLNLPKD